MPKTPETAKHVTDAEGNRPDPSLDLVTTTMIPRPATAEELELERLRSGVTVEA